MTNLHYRVIEHCEDSYYKAPKRAISCDVAWAANRCADDYWSEHDGWESWDQGEALTFALHDGENGKEVGRYAVSYDISPDFSARAIC